MMERLRQVVAGEDLTRLEAADLMQQWMEGKGTAAQIGALLTALRMKGETVEEITGFAEAMRRKVLPVKHTVPDAVDTCGTGGDGGKTFNVSTATSILAAGMGVPVAKHGNRSVSSRSGSADVLEALGVEMHMSAEEAVEALHDIGICFMFAPIFHPSMHHVMPMRKELGIRTCFNVLGPLTNPANVKRQLVGVYDPSLTELLAWALNKLGVERALVVTSDDGLDEISVSAPTRVSELRDGNVITYELTPEDLGLATHPLHAVSGGDAEYNAAIIRRIFAGEKGAPRDIVVANTAAVLYLADHVDSIQEGVLRAKRALDEGIAQAKLSEMVTFKGGKHRVS